MNGGPSAIGSLMCTAHPVAQLLGDGVNDAIRGISEGTETDHLSSQSQDKTYTTHVWREIRMD